MTSITGNHSATDSLAQDLLEQGQWESTEIFHFPFDPKVEGECIEKLIQLSKLSDNWDGGGALAPSAHAIESAKAFVRRIDCRTMPEIRPTADGEVQFDWRHKDRGLELEFSDEGEISFLKADFANDEYEESDIASPATSLSSDVRAFNRQLADLLSWLEGN